MSNFFPYVSNRFPADGQGAYIQAIRYVLALGVLGESAKLMAVTLDALLAKGRGVSLPFRTAKGEVLELTTVDSYRNNTGWTVKRPRAREAIMDKELGSFESLRSETLIRVLRTL